MVYPDIFFRIVAIKRIREIAAGNVMITPNVLVSRENAH